MSWNAVVLVVDDSEDDILVLRRAFRAVGILNPVVAVRSGEEAISYLQAKGKYSSRSEFPLPRIILLDLKMPGLDGFETLSWIRSRKEFAGISVIVLTSSNQVKDIQRAYRLGANSFIAKEIEFQDVVAMSRMLKEYWLGLNTAYQVTRTESRDERESR
jgi:two-component system response regulator